MASTYLTKTFAQAGNRRTFTISYWIKMGQVSTGADQAIMGAAQDGSNSDDLYIHTGRLNFSGYYGSTAYMVRTTAKYRDLSGWYHHVIRFDSTQSTASDRLRLYVNGEVQTDLANNTYPSQNFQTTYINTARLHTIGSFAIGSLPNTPFDGAMSHFHFTDGYSYGADSFGETDSTTGIWKPKTAPSVTYGTNGYFLKFENSASMGTDSAGSNNFTVSGTMTQLIDTPSNVFATLNPLDNFYGNTTLTEGNNTFNQTASSGNHTFIPSTLGFSSGKWYWEMKCVSNSSNSDMWYGTGITSNSSGGDNHYLGSFTNDYGVFGYSYSSGKAATYTGGTRTDQGTSFATGDIIGVAVDCDNLAMYVHKNGVYMPDASSVTGVPTSGASRTGALFDITAPSSTTKGFYFPALCYYDVRAVVQSVNFGNGFFGTTAITSAGSNGNGSLFEYDVPSGYYALNTKNLNTYG